MAGSEEKYTTLVVLNDGDTWTTVSGCSLIVVNEMMLEELNAGNPVKDIKPILEIGLQEYHPREDPE